MSRWDSRYLTIASFLSIEPERGDGRNMFGEFDHVKSKRIAMKNAGILKCAESFSADIVHNIKQYCIIYTKLYIDIRQQRKREHFQNCQEEICAEILLTPLGVSMRWV